jgi:hypothetical protein
MVHAGVRKPFYREYSIKISLEILLHPVRNKLHSPRYIFFHRLPSSPILLQYRHTRSTLISSSTGKKDKMSRKISAELNTALRAGSSECSEGIEVEVEDVADIDVDNDVAEEGERRMRLSGRSGEVDDRRLGLESGSILYSN